MNEVGTEDKDHVDIIMGDAQIYNIGSNGINKHIQNTNKEVNGKVLGPSKTHEGYIDAR